MQVCLQEGFERLSQYLIIELRHNIYNIIQEDFYD